MNPVSPAELTAARASTTLGELGAELESQHRLVMLGTMTAAIAHEINNALTPVITYCQLANAHPEDAELGRKALGRALLGAERAARIAGVVLDLARGTSLASGLEIERAEADLVAVARTVVDGLIRDPAKDGVQIAIEVMNVDRRAAIRPTALHQVLLNLVLNGVRAVSSGGVLAIRCIGHEPKLAIEIEDNGPGLPEDVRLNLFKPFTTGSRKDGGTGLGLLVVKTLVEDAGGTVQVRPAAERGTIFRIELPAALEHSAAAA